MSKISEDFENFSWHLPSLFPLSRKAVSICENPGLEADRLYRMICLDPVLFSQTLRVFNYFHPGETGKYSSIARIIIILNKNTVKNFILHYAKNACEQSGVKRSKETIKTQRKQWLHSHATGIAGRFLAKARGVPGEKLEEYYAAGLMHDIKKYLYKKVDAKNVPEIININQSLLDVINYHYRRRYLKYTGAFKDIVYNTALANQLVNIEHTAPSDTTTQKIYAKALLDELKVNKDILKDVVGIVKQELQNSIRFLENITEHDPG